MGAALAWLQTALLLATRIRLQAEDGLVKSHTRLDKAIYVVSTSAPKHMYAACKQEVLLDSRPHDELSLGH